MPASEQYGLHDSDNATCIPIGIGILRFIILLSRRKRSREQLCIRLTFKCKAGLKSQESHEGTVEFQAR